MKRRVSPRSYDHDSIKPTSTQAGKHDFQAAEALDALVLHDSRVSKNDNAIFLDLMEDNVNQPLDDLQKDERPELGYYQVASESP